ncbi:hypothetical protein K2173_000869 [Erythroxylum novogranatense]|uniref:U-box domain-containing protein n=1 Tax=Erythroxylum novogranatense TaxID=1862640 RepID=A0AAV8TT82_9ROSI|nr:hypothetical protein K2173_000869 [Erythroxylum novogranatense]
MQEPEVPIPHLFRCPISLDLFEDPVTLCTGQTYDRSSIEKWLSAGNLTCPVTMQKLADASMVPNHTLRHLIDQWLKMGPQAGPDYFSEMGCFASLKHNLQSQDVSWEKKLLTLKRIQTLAEESPSNSSHLLQPDILPLLLKLVFSGKAEHHRLFQERVMLVEQTLCCVLKLLSLGELEVLNMLKEESNLESFQVLFHHGTINIKGSLCRLIQAISSSLLTRELCLTLGKCHQLLRGLVLTAVHENCQVSEAAIKAISGLCSLESNRETLIQQGVINGLLTYIYNARRHERSLAPKAMATIELLLGLESARKDVINHPNGIRTIVKMVFQVSDHEGSESAINSLIILCTESLQAREEAIGGGVLSQLLLLLQSQCSSRTKTNARILLKLLRS